MRRVVVVKDKMQQGYRYELSAPAGRDFDPQFRPEQIVSGLKPDFALCGPRRRRFQRRDWNATGPGPPWSIWSLSGRAAANRLASTRKALATDSDEHLDAVRRSLLTLDPTDIAGALRTAMEIKGLGVAGASGLLALIYPEHFGTVDQFVVERLCEIDNLPEYGRLARMNPQGLTINDGVVLTTILRRKAAELGHGWTPRKVEAVLWAVER